MTVPETTRRYHLGRRPDGLPDNDVFERREVDVAEPSPGEVCLRVLYLSVDPYMRDRMRAGESYSEPWAVGDPLRGGAVAEVVASDGGGFDPGDLVVGNLPWAEYATVASGRLNAVDVGDQPVSTALGVLGMPGRTAYFGTTEVAAPGPGDTFVITGAAGAVGSTAGQLARLAGAEVVGFAGSDEKCRVVESEFGFDACLNYRSVEDYGAALDDRVDGVDCYFDNVGGPITDAVFPRLNVDGRVAVCGQISLYNESSTPTGPRKLPGLVRSRATVEGFLVRDFAPRYAEATRRLREWVAAGDVAYRETVSEGLSSAPEAFRGLFRGDNVGKQLVQVAER
ncbi:MAG: NADP-dependent oxidoreductase [Halolamina sp.]